MSTNFEFSLLRFFLSCMVVNRNCLNHGIHASLSLLHDQNSFDVRIDHIVALLEELLPKNDIEEV